MGGRGVREAGWWRASALLACASVIAAVATTGCGSASAPASTAPPSGATPASSLPATTEAFPGTVVLGRPTESSVAVSLVATSDLVVYAQLGTAADDDAARTADLALAAGRPGTLELTGLPRDAAIVYRLCFRGSDATLRATPPQTFHTQRAPGSSFTFAVEADPHIDVDRKMQPALFRAALANVLAERPDFLVDLGDTFLGDKLTAPTERSVDALYANDRSYFGLVGPSVPLFLVNGNHEGEDGWWPASSAGNLEAWASTARRSWYPVPSADGYYAWQWGDALFVVLDPYSYTTTNPKQSGDLWDWTLGDTQYRWLSTTLASSTANYKFVFSHHALGDVRGGVEWSRLYEWGGGDKGGTRTFASERPGWELPIHQLFVRYGVTIFFQGHDHLFVRQEADGVIYQEVPQPATIGNAQNDGAYRSGVILASPGHLQVTVADAGVTVAYIRSSVNADGTPAADNGTILYSYTASARAGR